MFQISVMSERSQGDRVYLQRPEAPPTVASCEAQTPWSPAASPQIAERPDSELLQASSSSESCRETSESLPWCTAALTAVRSSH